MFSIKSLPHVLIISLTILYSLYCFAQEDPGYIDEKEAKGEEIQEINSGYVVMHGILLPRPYYVSLRDDTIRINDIPFRPLAPDPNPPVYRYPQLNDTAEQIIALMSEMREKIIELFEEYPEERAEMEVFREYARNPLIRDMIYIECERRFYVVYEGTRMSWSFYTYNRTTTYSRIPSHDEIMVHRKVGYERIQSRLKRGNMTFRDYGREKVIHEEDAIKIIQIVCSLKQGIIGADVGRERILDILHDEEITQDIIDNVDSWTCDNK